MDNEGPVRFDLEFEGEKVSFAGHGLIRWADPEEGRTCRPRGPRLRPGAVQSENLKKGERLAGCEGNGGNAGS